MCQWAKSLSVHLMSCYMSSASEERVWSRPTLRLPVVPLTRWKIPLGTKKRFLQFEGMFQNERQKRLRSIKPTDAVRSLWEYALPVAQTGSCSLAGFPFNEVPGFLMRCHLTFPAVLGSVCITVTTHFYIIAAIQPHSLVYILFTRNSACWIILDDCTGWNNVYISGFCHKIP